MTNALFVAWRSGDLNRQGWGPVGRLDYDGQTYQFCYTRGARTLQDFRPFPQMQDMEQVYESESLFPLFANRLLPRSRSEYEAFLSWSGFDVDSQPDPIAVLGVTEGIRQTDAIEVFPCPVPDVQGCYLNKFFLHGVRWVPTYSMDRIEKLQRDEQLYLMLDLNNEFDQNAVAVRTNDERTMIGYVPRYLARDVYKLLQGCPADGIELFVDRVNRDAPTQQRVLCRMHACWPHGFQPCSDEAFQPIPTDVPTKCEA
jgi:HIRAN domain